MVSISKAKVSDAPGIRKLEQQIWREKETTGKYEDGYIIRFEYAFVAKEKNKIIGAILAMRTTNDEIYVEDIIISPRFQHQGIDRKLYSTLLAHCGDHTILALVNVTNESSIALHKELGFKGVKKIVNPFGVKEETVSFLMKKEKKAL